MPRGWETVNRKQREGGAAFPVHSSTESNMASRINYRELVTLNRPNKTPTLQAIMSPTSGPRNNVCTDHAWSAVTKIFCVTPKGDLSCL